MFQFVELEEKQSTAKRCRKKEMAGFQTYFEEENIIIKDK